MAILIKFIALPLYPLGLAITFLFVAIICLFFKNVKASQILMFCSFGVLVLFSLPPITNLLGTTLEYQVKEALPPPGSDATIVVLGGGGVPLVPPRKYPEVNEAGDRMLLGARLYKTGYGKRVVTTGGDVGTSFFEYPSEAEENALVLQAIGVDSMAIIREHKARNTHEHPKYIAAILDSVGSGRTIILVTTASHMYRAVAVFKKYGGFTIYTAPTDYSTTRRVVSRSTDFFPNVSAFERSTEIVHEYYGILAYKLFGWI
jgi:uncharacterized SAM-binding protein YcdF (DUF218 family)